MAAVATIVIDDEDRVKGSRETMKQAEIGMKLFEQEAAAEVEYDIAGATTFKEGEDVKMAALDDVIKGLTGKDNKKAKTEKEKEKKAIKDSREYIDAEKVIKGKHPQNGFWVKKSAEEEQREAAAAASAVAAAAKTQDAVSGGADDKVKEKKEKPKKAQESAGISPAERQELDKLKGDIIARKADLKGQGMSGGQMNKDEHIAAWVTRMNELKEKECPGSTAPTKGKSADKKKATSTEQEAAISEVEREIEEYRVKLMTEFKYTKKEISADPDMQDLQANMKTLTGKK